MRTGWTSIVNEPAEGDPTKLVTLNTTRVVCSALAGTGWSAMASPSMVTSPSQPVLPSRLVILDARWLLLLAAAFCCPRHERWSMSSELC